MATNEGELKCDVCDFIVEIKRENGEQYPPTSLYDLLQGLSMHLEHNTKNKLISCVFKQIQNTFDNIMKERTAEGIPGRPECDYISKDHEQLLWDKDILGKDSPDKLCKTIFFY